MKNLDLLNYGVATMSTREMETTNGGGWLIGIIVAVILGVVIAKTSGHGKKYVPQGGFSSAVPAL